MVYTCQDSLWSKAGERARAWLKKRGLRETIIRREFLGFNTADVYEDRQVWGLPISLNTQGQPKRVWLPKGITIPWFIGPDLWRVNIRRPVGAPKYIGPAGFGNGLFAAVHIQFFKDLPVVPLDRPWRNNKFTRDLAIG